VAVHYIARLEDQDIEYQGCTAHLVIRSKNVIGDGWPLAIWTSDLVKLSKTLPVTL